MNNRSTPDSCLYFQLIDEWDFVLSKDKRRLWPFEVVVGGWVGQTLLLLSPFSLCYSEEMPGLAASFIKKTIVLGCCLPPPTHHAVTEKIGLHSSFNQSMIGKTNHRLISRLLLTYFLGDCFRGRRR